jgi:RNA polymerase sigma factor (sigma-70 family)
MARMAGSDNESQLIEQSVSGDPEAYAALVVQHQAMIRAVTFRMTGSLDDAEELAQDAFLRAYRRLGSFGGNSKFSTWLCKIAINLSLDWRRRESRRDEIHSKWAAEFLTNFRGECRNRSTACRQSSVPPSFLPFTKIKAMPKPRKPWAAPKPPFPGACLPRAKN